MGLLRHTSFTLGFIFLGLLPNQDFPLFNQFMVSNLSKMGSEEDPRVECGSPTPFPTVKELISQLRSSFFATEFQRVEKTLVDREGHMKEKQIELEKKSEALEKQKDLLCLENIKLNDELQKKQQENLEYTDQIKVLNGKVSKNLELENEMKKKKSEIAELKKLNVELERREAELRAYKKHFLDLGDRVVNLEKTAKELVGCGGTPLINVENKQQKTCATESSKLPFLAKKGDSTKKAQPKIQETIKIDNPPLFGKKGDSSKRTEPKEIIYIDDEDNDLEFMSTLKRKRCSNKIERKCNDDNIPTGTQKRTNLQELHKQPMASRPLSTPRLVERKPCLEKLEPKNPQSSLDKSDSSSGSDEENLDEVYKYIITKKKTQNERWGIEADMIKDINKDDDLCMNAVCALHRQIIQGKLKPLGDHISRITQLKKLIINGDPQQKVKKTAASELNRSDLDDCRRFAKGYSSRLFKIYQNKDDPFFPSF